uniref:CSON001130 protein n=1 Tax=Culicoides sonorensis TaxID=179676 RepID=A0A336MGJ0_CULSO
MCNIENQSEFYKIHPIGGMLTRDQRTIVTFEYKKNYNNNKNCDNVSEKPGYSDECFCETNNYKKKVNSNYNKSQVLTQKMKCDRFSNSFITKKRHTGYRNLSQFKLKYCKSLTLYCLLLLIQITFARPTFFSPNSPYYRHIRAPLKMSSEDHPDYARILEECNTPNMDQQKIDLRRIKKMLESTINTSNIALQEANISGNAFL